MGIALVCMVNHTALASRQYRNVSLNDSEIIDVCLIDVNDTGNQPKNEV